jgi:hypothetical protein
MESVIQFTKEDIKDQEMLHKMVQEEAKRIYESAQARKGRSWKVIEGKVWQGKPAEVWLIENMGYTVAPPVTNAKGDLTYYHDLIDPNGMDITEVKAWNPNYITTGVESTVYKIKSGTWNMSTQMIVFAYEPQEYRYTYVDKIKIR